MKAFDYAVAHNEAGIAAALQKGYHILAGGVDLLDRLKAGIEPAERVVSINALEAYRRVKPIDDGLEVGALVTLQAMAEDEQVRAVVPLLATVAAGTASPQVRARATLGGNLLQRPRCGYYRSAAFHCLKKGGHRCFAWDGENGLHSIFAGGACRITHPSSLAPVVVALRAELRAHDGQDTVRHLAGDFFVNTDEQLLRENVLPAEQWLTSLWFPPGNVLVGHVEIKPRAVYDWPIASCVVAFSDNGWRVVLGHVAPLPWRARAAEELLGTRAEVDDDLAAVAAAAAVADAEPMRDNGYRVRVAQAAVRRALLQACGRPAEGLA